MAKRALNVSVIDGTDGPTSFFIVRKTDKIKSTERIKRFFREIKKNRIKKTITANPHTPEEVEIFLKREYGAVEMARQSSDYLEQRKCIKASLIIRHRPDLLGEASDIAPPERDDAEALKEFWEQLALRNAKAEAVADDIFPIDFHIYEIRYSNVGRIEIGMENIWKEFGVSYSGDKKCARQLKKILKDIYLYYGVSDEDIKKESKRYSSLLAALCS